MSAEQSSEAGLPTDLLTEQPSEAGLLTKLSTEQLSETTTGSQANTSTETKSCPSTIEPRRTMGHH
jgi:hypothetical protein